MSAVRIIVCVVCAINDTHVRNKLERNASVYSHSKSQDFELTSHIVRACKLHRAVNLMF